MNLNNLRRLKKFGLSAEIVAIPGGSPHLRLTLTTGEQSGFASPPHVHTSDKFSTDTEGLSDIDLMVFEENDPSTAVADRVLDALARTGLKIATARADRRLSEQGCNEACRTAISTAIVAVAKQYTKLSGIASDLADDHSELYSPPAPDASSTLIDVELRSAFRGMTDGDKVALLTNLSEAHHARMLLALTRSPMHLGDRDHRWVSDAWDAAIAKEEPDSVARYKVGKENFEWAEQLARFVASWLVSLSSGMSITREQLYLLVKDTNGKAAFDFTDQEVSHLELRLAQSAA